MLYVEDGFNATKGFTTHIRRGCEETGEQEMNEYKNYHRIQKVNITKIINDNHSALYALKDG